MARRPEMLQEVRVKAGSGQDGLSADGAKTVYGGYKPQTRKERDDRSRISPSKERD
jgi:hypothetical protein